MKIEISRQFFEKCSSINFHENPCCGSRVIPWEQTDGRTDMTKLIVAFRNFANAPINITHVPKCSIKCSDTPEFTIHPISRPHYCIHRTWRWSTVKLNNSLFFLPMISSGSGKAVQAFPRNRHATFHAPWMMSSRSHFWPGTSSSTCRTLLSQHMKGQRLWPRWTLVVHEVKASYLHIGVLQNLRVLLWGETLWSVDSLVFFVKVQTSFYKF
jgi:hypothetical protein